MRPISGVILVFFASLLLASCGTTSVAPFAGTSESTPLRAYVENQNRLYRVAAPLLIKNAALCRSYARPLLGFTAKNQYSYSKELIGQAKNQLRLDERLQVMSVLNGSGAMQAGIRHGDILLKVQDQAIPQGQNAETDAARLLAGMVSNNRKLQLTVLRNGKALALEIPLTLACAFAIEQGNTSVVNAYNDGRRILITRGMLDFFATDAGLAAMLAREMAHNTLQHASALQMSATVSGVIDQLLPMQPDLSGFAGTSGIKTTPEKMDEEADKLAAYLLARAGLDPATLQVSLQTLANAYPGTVTNGYTALHPLTAERVSNLQMTVTEIRRKQAAKKALVP